MKGLLQPVPLRKGYDSLYKVHLHTLLYIVKYEIKIFIFTLDVLLCYNYFKHSNIQLFSMTRRVAAQKQCIIKKIVSMHSIFLCIL